MEQLHLPDHRDARLAAIAHYFPDAAGPDASIPGGRIAALAALDRVDPVAYARSRNHLHGAVTRLSPYLRHGCLALNEVREWALAKSGPSGAYRLVFELAWRDFWRRVWFERGDEILRDIEPAKVPLSDAPFAADITTGNTGLACIDDSIHALLNDGYVHNHARMWFAAYVVHFRKIAWREGADWYVQHLLDGDVASNHLSWQWVASTFSNKPYFFNRENVQKYTDGKPCMRCTASRDGSCPFDASYESLDARLFSRGART